MGNLPIQGDAVPVRLEQSGEYLQATCEDWRDTFILLPVTTGPPAHRATAITIAVVTPGLSYLYRSANGGKTWAEIAVSGTSGGVSLSFCPT